MKYLILMLSFFLAGCNKSDLDKERDAREYLQAGMIDKAEKYYQDLILSEDENMKHANWLWKDQLLQLYLKSNQLDKADRYMAFVIFIDSNGMLDYELMSRSHSEVAKSLYNEKKYSRAYFHYKASADYKVADKNRNKEECSTEAIEFFALAYDSAKKAELSSEFLQLTSSANALINEKSCLNNQLAREYLNYFQS
ncbi:hypothetical protein GCM10010960_13310 [Arenimonas maotaiensis]|uniref:Uncharacterized protein n=1 Tax=Arenimonas maotaiensis TaxID=1446479 RepID=A0A917CLJ8_9GAMM|nr:hypothetical protein [Arenimonas maotaiensis]GGF92736.1 hypothetical protein GCM10010960_13310 [Arenimonas maotaiensis]